MSLYRRTVTIAIHREGDPESQLYRLPAWLFKTLVVGAVVFVVLVAIAAALYTPMARLASRVPRLNRQIERLTEENTQVVQLATTLRELEARYAQIRTVLGAEIVPEPVTELEEETDRLVVVAPLEARAPGVAPPFGLTGPSDPNYWPLDSLEFGVVTRGFGLPGSSREPHPGIDIAVPRGTPIRAAGGGGVAEAGFDPEYGLFVLVDHPNGFRTMYGHASRLLVAAGDQIDAGQVIALSGTTGRSTAPHLHFEKRLGDLLLDPRASSLEE